MGQIFSDDKSKDEYESPPNYSEIVNKKTGHTTPTEVLNMQIKQLADQIPYEMDPETRDIITRQKLYYNYVVGRENGAIACPDEVKNVDVALWHHTTKSLFVKNIGLNQIQFQEWDQKREQMLIDKLSHDANDHYLATRFDTRVVDELGKIFTTIRRNTFYRKIMENIERKFRNNILVRQPVGNYVKNQTIDLGSVDVFFSPDNETFFFPGKVASLLEDRYNHKGTNLYVRLNITSFRREYSDCTIQMQVTIENDFV
jgi:hypothetical protein